MASRRQANKPTGSVRSKAKRTVDSAAEETKRIEEAALESGAEAARAGVNLVPQNAEMSQKSWSVDADMAGSVLTPFREQSDRTFVFGYDAQRATDRSVRIAETILYSATAVAKGLNGASQEYLDFVRQRFAKNMERMNELWRCRTPQDVAAIQRDLVRETVSDLFERNRRIADMARRLADDAGNHIARSLEARRAA